MERYIRRGTIDYGWGWKYESLRPRAFDDNPAFFVEKCSPSRVIQRIDTPCRVLTGSLHRNMQQPEVYLITRLCLSPLLACQE